MYKQVFASSKHCLFLLLPSGNVVSLVPSLFYWLSLRNLSQDGRKETGGAGGGTHTQPINVYFSIF